MKIHSSKLQRIFKYLTPSIGSPLKLPEFNSFLFDITENNLMVRIYNGTTESIVNMQGEFEPMRFAVDEFIYQIINQLNGEISLELDDTNLLVDCGAKHYTFSTIDCELWQPIMNMDITEPFDLKSVQSFNKVRHAVATDESRPIYTGYHIRDGKLFTSDGFRAVMIPVNLDDFGLPQKELDSILRCLDGTVYHKFDDAIYFRCESDEFEVKYATSKMEGEPFDCEKIFVEKESIEVLASIVFDNLENELKDILILERQARKLGDATFKLHIKKENELVYFCTHISGLSDSIQQVNCEITGDDFEIVLNPIYLMDFAEVANKVTMKILPNDEIGNEEPVLLYESEMKSLIMPMRIPK